MRLERSEDPVEFPVFLSNFKIDLKANYAPDDGLWWLHCRVDNHHLSRTDNEFTVRCIGPQEPFSDNPYRAGVLTLTNLRPAIIRKAIEIGVRILSDQGFLSSDDVLPSSSADEA